MAVILALAIICVPLCQANCQPQPCAHPCCPSPSNPSHCENGVNQPAATTCAVSVAPFAVVSETIHTTIAHRSHQARPTYTIAAFRTSAQSSSTGASPIPLRI